MNYSHFVLVISLWSAAEARGQYFEVEFNERKMSEVAKPKLDFLEGICHDVYERLPSKIDWKEAPHNFRNLKVLLPYLTEEKFNYLKRYFGNYSNIKYSASEKYSLEDFLLPPMQALVGHSFRTVEQVHMAALDQEINRPMSVQHGKVSGHQNCWGTAFELTRRKQDEFYAYLPNPSRMREVLGNRKYSSLVHRFSEMPQQFGKDPRHLANLQPFDMLVLEYQDYLLHVSTYLGGGLFFEKVGSECQYYFRIAHFNDLIASYSNKNTVTSTYLRYNENMRQVPHPQHLFHTGDPRTRTLNKRYKTKPHQTFIIHHVADLTDEIQKVALMSKMPIMTSEIGRSSFLKSAFTKEYFLLPGHEQNMGGATIEFTQDAKLRSPGFAEDIDSFKSSCIHRKGDRIDVHAIVPYKNGTFFDHSSATCGESGAMQSFTEGRPFRVISVKPPL